MAWTPNPWKARYDCGKQSLPHMMDSSQTAGEVSSRLIPKLQLSIPNEASSIYYILKTPHLVPFSAATPPNAALRPCPNILLVCAGGIIPSSQRRAEENTASLSRSIRAFSSGSTVLPTAAITELSCSEPMTPIFAFGHIQRNRGE